MSDLSDYARDERDDMIALTSAGFERAQIIAGYERARVVCDECGGSGKLDSGCPTPDGGTCGYTVKCSNPGPMLKGVDGPFHAAAGKLRRWCQTHDQVARYDEAACIDGDLYPDPESECSLVWVALQVWEEA